MDCKELAEAKGEAAEFSRELNVSGGHVFDLKRELAISKRNRLVNLGIAQCEEERADKAEREVVIMRRAWKLHDNDTDKYSAEYLSGDYIDRAHAELDGQKGNYKPTPDSVGTAATCGEGIIFEEWEKKSNVEIDGQKGKDDAK